MAEDVRKNIETTELIRVPKQLFIPPPAEFPVLSNYYGVVSMTLHYHPILTRPRLAMDYFCTMGVDPVQTIHITIYKCSKRPKHIPKCVSHKVWTFRSPFHTYPPTNCQTILDVSCLGSNMFMVSSARYLYRRRMLKINLLFLFTVAGMVGVST